MIPLKLIGEDKKVIDEHAFNVVIKGLTDLFKANK